MGSGASTVSESQDSEAEAQQKVSEGDQEEIEHEKVYDSRWLFLKLAARMVGYYNVAFTREDLQDEAVQEFMHEISGIPELSDANLADKIESSVEQVDEETRHIKRRERVAREAAEHVARFEALSEEEKEKSTNNGDMELYSAENQKLRELIFDDDGKVNQLLDKWWHSAVIYFDKDKNQVLTKDEYSLFHRRLIRIVEEAEGKEIYSEEEMEKMMEEDFHVDSGADGSVDCEEYRFAVFQMADKWTNSVDAKEYREFLKKGYDIVFKDLIDADKVKMPKKWAKEMKGVKSITPMPTERVVDTMTGIVFNKIIADKVDIGKGHPVDTMEEYVLENFMFKYGAGMAAKKQFKSFVLGLKSVIDDEADDYNHYATLFAQMAGVTTDSGRLCALPTETSVFILQHVDNVSEILTATKKAMSHKKKDQIGSSELVRGGVNAKSAALVRGFLDFKMTRNYLEKMLVDEFKLDHLKPLHKVAMVSLAALSTRLPSGDIVITCMRFTVLIGVLYSTLHTMGLEPRNPTEEAGAAEVAYDAGDVFADKMARRVSVPKIAVPPGVTGLSGVLEGADAPKLAIAEEEEKEAKE